MFFFVLFFQRDTLFNAGILARAAATTLRSAEPASGSGPTDLFLAITDHFEPQVGRVPRAQARERLEDWLTRYPRIAARHRDWDGRPPTHTFCYPWDEFDAWEMERLAGLCADGWGEIELHLHHADDTSESLRRTLREATETYRSYGALSTWPDGKAAFGFVHGNWSLDNSRCEGGKNFCGVNDELTLLQEGGCYADFTFPSWKKSSQPRLVNSLYYAIDDPQRPKSYDTGPRVRAGIAGSEGLLMVQGPLVPFAARAGRRFRLGMDDGDLAAYWRYRPERADRWIRAGISVRGRADRIFIKLHCHGCADWGREELLGEDLDALFSDLECRYNDGKRFRLHYVTAREMFNLIKATEAEAAGEPHELRSYLLPAPAASGIGNNADHRMAVAR